MVDILIIIKTYRKNGFPVVVSRYFPVIKISTRPFGIFGAVLLRW